jgi:hypothetical protein
MNENQIKARYPAERFLPVLISEVTRMNMGYYCLAGWDIHGRRMVRPLQSSGANWKLGTDRSVFSVGHLINCVPSSRRNAIYPHAREDLILSEPPSLFLTFDESITYALLINKTFTSIRQLFGCALVDDKYLPDGANCRSLGGVRVVRRRVRFIEDGFGKLRLQLQDTDNVSYRLSVTCDGLRRFFSPGDEDAEPHFGVAEANEWLRVNPLDSEIILRIGLARAWVGKDGDWNPRRCYTQLNGIICPEDNYHIFAGPPSV